MRRLLTITWGLSKNDIAVTNQEDGALMILLNN
jgi:hypothetical protein